MGFIKRSWRGEEKLWKVFWLYGVLLGIGIGLVAVAIKAVLGMGAYVCFWVLRIVYIIWLTVAQWRCAFNTDWKFWGYVVRVLIVLNLILIPAGLLVGGVLVGQDLIKAAECRKELKDYIAQGGTDVDGFKKQCIQRQLHTGAVAPATALTLPPLPDPNQAQYTQACQQTMTEFAQKKGFDPKAYIAQNQDYLQQCVQYYLNKASLDKKTP